MKHLAFIFALTSLLAISCAPPQKFGTVQFSRPANKNFAHSKLKAYLKENPNPKIVLRVPATAANVTTEEKSTLGPIYNSMYSAVEKELLKGGFIVRDRGLFNEVLTKSPIDNYSKIGTMTDTDLILEIVYLNRNVKYGTNRFKTKKGKEVKLTRGEIVMYGAVIEYKFIIISSNDVAGIYQFNYVPCEYGCSGYIDSSGNIYPDSESGSTNEVKAYEYIEVVEVEQFMSQVTQDLIREIRK